MTPERLARINVIFAIALDRDEAGQPLDLEPLCAGDTDLLREVTELVEEHRLRESRVNRGEDFPEAARRRFGILSRVGSGAFGDVYKIHDEERGGIVALKVLRDTSPAALLYFKQEFRALAGIQHPNLIRLHELFCYDNRWMFTMEYVEGDHFLHYVGSGPAATREQRIRPALAQLADALSALHTRGLVHRDLKPSNVLIRGDGRLSLLDFGLVRPLDGAGFPTIAGTVEYMAPEVAKGEALTQFSDWYAVGVMLYQALTGVLPFKGSLIDMFQQREPPAPPAELVPGISRDLSELCLSLLHADPGQRRAPAESILRGPWPPNASPPAKPATLLGRGVELERLEGAYSQAAGGRAIAAHIRGPSGAGKTVFLREFLNRVRSAEPSALVLAGRCYQSESVPFRGIDELVDNLSRYLHALPAPELAQVLPRNFPLIARMFPVLERVAAPGSRFAAPVDSAELRVRAFAALRDLFGRIAERRRVVLAIDDLQWGDADGCAFLRELIRPGDPLPLLLLLAYRSEDVDAIPGLESLRDSPEAVLIDLGPLSEEDTARLAILEAGGRTVLDERATRAVVEQSGGDPFLVREAVQWMLARSGDNDLAPDFNIERVLRSRFDRLNPLPQRLLTLIAAAGQPVPLDALRHLIDPPDLLPSRDDLLRQRLLRSRNVEGRDELEVFHDRIRAAIAGFLAPETLRSCHGDIACALESAGNADPETLALHFSLAGNRVRAKENARLAARRAAAALAFNNAAHFYRMAIDNGTAGEDDDATLYRSLGDVLSHAGRGPDAARAYLRAADFSGTHGAEFERRQLACLAATQLLRSGIVREGSDLLRRVLGEVGIGSPRNRKLQILQLILLRARIRVRGFKYRERPAAELPREQLLRLDLCATAAFGFATSDPLRSAEFSSRYVLLALRAGEPYHAALALAGEATQVAHTGGKRRFEMARALIGRSSAIAARLAIPHAEAFILLMSGVVSYLEGRWKRCGEECASAIELLRAKCNGISWELSTANTFLFIARSALGEWSENRRHLPGVIAEAEARGDLYAVASLRLLSGAYVLELARGQAEKALRDLDRDVESWASGEYDLQRAAALLARVDISIYQDGCEEGWRHTEQEWPLLQRTWHLRLGPTFAFTHFSRGRIALAMADRHTDNQSREKFLEVTRRSAESILAKGAGWSHGLARLLLAGIASFEGAGPAAVQLTAAAEELQKADLVPFRMAALYRLASTAPGNNSTQLQEVMDWAARQQISNLQRVFAGLAPGRWPALLQKG